MATALGWLIVWLTIAYQCLHIAMARGHSKQRWSFLALFFGPLA